MSEINGWDEVKVLRAEVARLTKEREEVIEVLKETKALLQREQVKAARMSIVEVMTENPNVDAHVTEWESRCLKAEAEVARLRDSLDARDRLIRDLLQDHEGGFPWFCGLWNMNGCGHRTPTAEQCFSECWEKAAAAKRAEWESLKGNAPGETGKGSERGT